VDLKPVLEIPKHHSVTHKLHLSHTVDLFLALQCLSKTPEDFVHTAAYTLLIMQVPYYMLV
jgi:hypothetical protein